MATYAIGDVQGCYDVLQRLLAKIHFDPASDVLWFTGDLVNRGSDSLQTLRFIKNLGNKQRTVLGNHDLHLLACHHGAHPGFAKDTLHDILTAPDRAELMTWLSQQPLLHHDPQLNYVMVHAGLAAAWDLTTAKACAAEVSACLQSDKAFDFLQHMYGNEPSAWQPELMGIARLRCITNFLTRARFCDPSGRLNLSVKGTLAEANASLIPWFRVPHRQTADTPILFGHWAALGGVTDTPNTYALDTGCVWGVALTAMRLEDQRRFSEPATR